jgi:hypothetical protein
LVIGGEGEYGFYLMDCDPESSLFGAIRSITINIPESGQRIWRNFTEFAEDMILYCRDYPLSEYRENCVMSSPQFGD